VKLSPHLSFNGNCREAFKFYAETLGGKVIAEMTYGQSPMAANMPKELLDQIIHAQLEVGPNLIMGADAPPGHYHAAAGVMLMWAVDELDKAKTIFDTLARGGNITTPWSPTFFAEGFGMCTDRYGTQWMVGKLRHPGAG
jgi:PhnB protein